MGVAAARMISIIRLLFSSTTLWAIQVPYMMIASKRNISSAEMTAMSATSWASVSGTTDEACWIGRPEREIRRNEQACLRCRVEAEASEPVGDGDRCRRLAADERRCGCCSAHSYTP